MTSSTKRKIKNRKLLYFIVFSYQLILWDNRLFDESWNFKFGAVSQLTNFGGKIRNYCNLVSVLPQINTVSIAYKVNITFSNLLYKHAVVLFDQSDLLLECTRSTNVQRIRRTKITIGEEICDQGYYKANRIEYTKFWFQISLIFLLFKFNEKPMWDF